MRAGAWALATMLAVAPVAHAQEPAASSPPDETTVRASVTDLARVESWSYFDPPPGGGNPDYTFIGNRLTFRVQASAPRWEVVGALQYIQLWNLPGEAFGPGALGTGALYYAAAEQSRAYQLYPRFLNLKLKELTPGLSITLGRMGYTSGAEADSGVPSIEYLKRQRLDSRLIGEFEWSIVQRAFDGVRVDVERKGWHLNGAALMPTQGGFEESATPTITDIQVGAAALTFRPHVVIPWSELQVFGQFYRDRRDIPVRPDNSGLVADAVDVTIGTVGAAQVGVFPTHAGEADSVVWLAAQIGDWYDQPHRAFSVAGEIGHRWTALAWQPWLRTGILYASGDSDPRDDKHGTFFQMLPTVRRYSQSATYAQMNQTDLFVQGWLHPHDRVTTRIDLHRIDVADRADGWYAGSGATEREGTFFGFTMRPSGGHRGFGTVLEASADVRLHRRWSVNGYIGTIWGGDVVRTSFAGNRLTFFYLENVLSF